MERVYSQRVNWENEPSIRTPLNEINLNKMDYALYEIDGRVVGFDTTKANQSEFLASLKSVNYNTTTGVFTFTYNNGETQTIDLNIEKIPISFSMSAQGVITMITADGTTYTADISSLIKETILVNTSMITWTMTTDASGNKKWTPTILDGSIPAEKLQPNFLADCLSAKSAAQNAADESEAERYKSEGYARGTADGEPVAPTSPYYHDNAKYWAEQAQAHATALSGLSDVDIDTPANGETLIYNSTSGKWENKEAASPINVIDNLTSDSATDALSAKQGKVLKGLVDNRIDKTATTELTAEEQANLKAQGLALNTDLTKLVKTYTKAQCGATYNAQRHNWNFTRPTPPQGYKYESVSVFGTNGGYFGINMRNDNVVTICGFNTDNTTGNLTTLTDDYDFSVTYVFVPIS